MTPNTPALKAKPMPMPKPRSAAPVPAPAAKAPALKPPSLAAQNVDFTAEGSPPPGKVAKAEPKGVSKLDPGP